MNNCIRCKGAALSCADTSRSTEASSQERLPLAVDCGLDTQAQATAATQLSVDLDDAVRTVDSVEHLAIVEQRLCGVCSREEFTGDYTGT